MKEQAEVSSRQTSSSRQGQMQDLFRRHFQGEQTELDNLKPGQGRTLRELTNLWLEKDPTAKAKVQQMIQRVRKEFPSADPIKEADWIRRKAEVRALQKVAADYLGLEEDQEV